MEKMLQMTTVANEAIEQNCPFCGGCMDVVKDGIIRPEPMLKCTNVECAIHSWPIWASEIGTKKGQVDGFLIFDVAAGISFATMADSMESLDLATVEPIPKCPLCAAQADIAAPHKEARTVSMYTATCSDKNCSLHGRYMPLAEWCVRAI